jgi:hypothetical protein
MNSIFRRLFVRRPCRLLVCSAIGASVVLCVSTGGAAGPAGNALGRQGADRGAAQRIRTDTANQIDSIPTGTVLPVLLPSISSKKLKEGDKITARVAQDVPLGSGAKIRRGAKVIGTVVSNKTLGAGNGAKLTIRFASVVQDDKPIPTRTSLRALASSLEVDDAQIPTTGPGESDVYDWLPTRQIGGDVVYGKGGPVARGSQVLGESTYQGVFVKLAENPEGQCRGPIGGNDRPQAVWLFSADACGLYGFANLQIRHAGRTEPTGEIELESKKGPVQIRSGGGALLRVVGGA